MGFFILKNLIYLTLLPYRKERVLKDKQRKRIRIQVQLF